MGGINGGTAPGIIGGGKGIGMDGLNKGLKGNGGVLPAIVSFFFKLNILEFKFILPYK